ncbi:hypothetical protein HYALB_00009500 [Hymenoscyphus albidus]|uniref:Uncharacterized protein n=1 Tax=Hymenoscyphus albidus TaxID=595503 RepID=A0A9N9Q682_9HELO|nr:hypothetical protein HYALB_00009500 [Hymenoscyphus albidus]
MPESQDRLDLLFKSDVRPWEYGSARQTYQPVLAPPLSPSSHSSHHPAARTHPTSSASSVSRRSSASTTASSVFSNTDAESASSRSSAPENPIPWDLNRQLTMGDYNSGYDLPCEFSFLGCQVQFRPELHQEWIAHGASHFTQYAPPPRLVCTFCDAEFDVSRNNGDRTANYRRRMNHIGEHFRNNRTLDVNLPPASHRRPDYHVLDYMRHKGLIDERDYKDLIRYSERPHCENLRPLGHVSPEMQARKSRDNRRPHDLAREERQRRKERDGKGKSTHHHRSIY